MEFTINHVEDDTELARWDSGGKPFPACLYIDLDDKEIGCYVEVDTCQHYGHTTIEIAPLNADGANRLMEYAKDLMDENLLSMGELIEKIRVASEQDFDECLIRFEDEYGREFFNYSDIAEQYGITSETSDARLYEIAEKLEQDCQANERGTVKLVYPVDFLECVRESTRVA